MSLYLCSQILVEKCDKMMGWGGTKERNTVKQIVFY